MWFDLAHVACSSSSGLQALICWRLLRQGKSLNFINLLFAIYFFINTVNSYVYINLLFKIGSVHFFAYRNYLEDVSAICKYYISSWLGLYTIGGHNSLGVVFCKFIYARYAHGLLADKGRLFH